MSRFSNRFKVEDAVAHITVEQEPEKGLGWITINRPEKLNALSVAMREYMSETLWRFNTDDTVKVVIIKSEGRAFVAGHELDEDWNARARDKKRLGLLEHARYNEDMMGGKTGYGPAFRGFSKVLMAQVQGYAFGGFFSIGLNSADIVVAAEEASIGSPNVRFTGSGGDGPWLDVGLKAGRWIGSSGEPMTGSRAAELGVAHIAVPRDQLAETTRRLAEKIAQRPLEEILYLKARLRAAESLFGVGRSRGTLGFLFMHKPDDDEPNFWRLVNQVGLRAALDAAYESAPRVDHNLGAAATAEFGAIGAGRGRGQRHLQGRA